MYQIRDHLKIDNANKNEICLVSLSLKRQKCWIKFGITNTGSFLSMVLHKGTSKGSNDKADRSYMDYEDFYLKCQEKKYIYIY